MIKKILILSLLIPFLLASQLYFMPFEAHQAKKELLDWIDHAHSSIDIAMYTLTNKTIAKHLKNAARRGVHIRIVFDYDQIKSRYSKLRYLAKYKNIDIFTLQGKYAKRGEYYGKMHIKMAIFDNKKLTFGSANWTNAAFSKNYEIIYFTKDFSLAKKAKRGFERLIRLAHHY